MTKIYRLLIAIILASTVPSLSACSTLGTVGGVAEVVAAPADEVFNTLADEKAYYAILRFEVAANQLAGTAVDMGVLRPGSRSAVMVADLLLELTDVTEAAQAAKAANDAATLQEKIDAGKSLYNRIMDVLA